MLSESVCMLLADGVGGRRRWRVGQTKKEKESWVKKKYGRGVVRGMCAEARL